MITSHKSFFLILIYFILLCFFFNFKFAKKLTTYNLTLYKHQSNKILELKKKKRQNLDK